MLMENCVRGLKVKTTGNTASGTTRGNSLCCQWEDRNGYLLVDGRNNPYVRLKKGVASTTCQFNIDQVEPFSLTQKE